MDTWTPTHQVVATHLEVTIAQVSRIRTGDRLPSLSLMARIKNLTGWSLDAQTKARDERCYARDFNYRLVRWAKTLPREVAE